MRRLYALILVFCVTSSVYAQKYTTNVDNIKNEKWWGGAVNLGTSMPYMTKISVDLSKSDLGNQTAPFLVSSMGRYVWSEKPFTYMFDENGTLTIKSDYEQVEVVVVGKSLREAYLMAATRHFKPTKTMPAELLITKPQYNTWIELMYNQNQDDILKYADDIIGNDFPVGVLMIDDNWQKYYGNFEFKPDRFSDAKAMISTLHEKGFKVMLWVCPFVSPDSPEYRELFAKGYLIKDKRTKKAAIIEWWNGYSACYDMTNPEAVEYLYTKLADVKSEFGVDGFKFDAGDVSFYSDENQLFYDTNALAVDQTQKWAELGLRFDFNEFRTSWKMGGAPLAQRLCDKSYSWDAVKSLVPNMLATGLMGHAYACPDLIGGGEFSSFLNIKEGEFDQKLIARSAQIHALMPMMQFSVAPWRVLDETYLGYCRDAAKLHVKFAPYIYELAKEASETGAPIVRHLEYEFPGKGFADCDDQFMLGNKYLVVPVVTEDNTRKVRLPNGKWIDDKGKQYKGPLVFNVNIEEGRLLYFEHQSKTVLEKLKSIVKKPIVKKKSTKKKKR